MDRSFYIFCLGMSCPCSPLNTCDFVKQPNQLTNIAHLRYWLLYETILSWLNNLRIFPITKKISLNSWRKRRVILYSFPSIIELVVKVTLSSYLTQKLSYPKHGRIQIIVSISNAVCLFYSTFIFLNQTAFYVPKGELWHIYPSSP